ncbi:acetylornithine deacetylase [Bacillus thermophilus]|uniref:Acetylornithine deacetylase n=1 Tax=Siminovitchia thermophila TaxID=1245522 RepID=A0ABS2R5U6_9BACI|nr:peptidase [Siminovitchia thermophila]MBM7715031.1 acetylornithine deacetylase [Siminovitchia thermophila]ONK22392.1 acetylornithine deacetylase [Bacillus sp. VT-16-64]
MEMKHRINQWIDENREAHIKFLQKLVQLASTQGNEKEVQDNVALFLNSLDLDVDVWELDGDRLKQHPYFYSNRETFENSPNVVGVLKGTGGGKSIILNGHVDVVPEGDHEQWDDDPYSGKIVDGKIYGRGATDMKGGNASLMIALDAVTSLDIRLKGDVIFQSVVEEESGGAGTLDAILKGYKADAAIIPEPTNMKIFPKQQGSKWFRLIITGRTAHGGTRYHGVSAIDKTFIVTEHIKELEKVRNDRITDPLYNNIPIPVPINMGVIKGGDWPSSVPDIVQLEGRIGIAPHETMEQVQAEMEQWMKKLSEKDEWFQDHPVEIEWFGARWVPGEIATDHPLMNSLISNFKAITNEDPVIEAAPWGTDGGLLSQVGDTPTVVFGPGTTGLAHYPNEAIDIEKIFEAAKIIAATIVDWCEVDS